MRTTTIDVEDATDRAELVGAHVIGLVLRSRERRSFGRRRRGGRIGTPSAPATAAAVLAAAEADQAADPVEATATTDRAGRPDGAETSRAGEQCR